jgi:hypothetical protein
MHSNASNHATKRVKLRALTVGLHLGHRGPRIVLLADALWSSGSGSFLDSAVRRLGSRSLGSGSSHCD